MSTRLRLPGTVALQSRDFRLFWIGYVSEVSGQQMLWVAQGWLIYELSGSALLLGAAGLARALPATVLTFVGGALADKVDQRRLLITVQVFQVLLLSFLGTLAAIGTVQVWHLLVIISISAAAQSFENPARQAIFPRLVDRSALMDAVALNSTVHPGTRFVGPFLAGLLMAQTRILTGEPLLGAAILFYLTAFGYVVNAGLISMLRVAALASVRKPTSVFADMVEGVRFITLNPIFGSLILLTYCMQFFGWSFQSLFPVFAKDLFGGGELELGLMGTMLGAGSLVGALAASNLAAVRRRGLLVIGGFTTASVLMVVFSFTSFFVVALGLLLVIGVTQSIFNVTLQSTLQYLVPNEFRGRVMGIWGMTHTAVGPLGQLALGVAAAALSAPLAVAGGGLAMLAYALVFVLPNARVRDLTLSADASQEVALARLQH